MNHTAIISEEFCNGALAGHKVELLELPHDNVHGTHYVRVTKPSGAFIDTPIQPLNIARAMLNQIVANMRAVYA